LREPGPETLELSDPLVAINWQLGEFFADFLKRQPNSLCKDDERYAAQH